MIPMKRRLVVGGVACLVACASLAHHSTRVFYDYDDDLEIEGEITWVLWRNPHVRFNLVRTGENGEEELWELEAGSVNTLERVGIGEGTLNVGDRVRAAGPPSRHGLNSIYVSNVLFEDGREVSLQGGQRLRWTDGTALAAATPAAREPVVTQGDVEGIFRVWSRDYSEGTESLPFRESAVAAREAWNPIEEDPALRCIPPGMPVAMDNPYPIAFIRESDDIVMLLEEWDGVRTIHMVENAAPRNSPRTPMGYSVGRWEGDALIVTTTHIDYPYFDSSGSPQGENPVIVERFTLSEDETRLEHHLTVTDDEVFTGPAELTQHYEWDPVEEIKRYECTLAD